MKKINILLLSLLCLSSILQAKDQVYSFLGIQTAVSEYQDTTAPSLGVKYGQQSQNIRTSISYDYAKNSSKQYQTLLMQIDTGILEKTFRESLFKPYMGVSLGFIQYEDKNTIDKGYVYGLNTGVTYLLNDAVDLDLGFHFMKTKKMQTINNINDLTFSLHYFY